MSFFLQIKRGKITCLHGIHGNHLLTGTMSFVMSENCLVSSWRQTLKSPENEVPSCISDIPPEHFNDT